MKTLIILAQSSESYEYDPPTDDRIVLLLALGGVALLGYLFNRWFEKGSSNAEKDEKPSSDKTEDTKESSSSSNHTQEEILKQLKAIKWILAMGFLYLMAVISGLLPAGTFG